MHALLRCRSSVPLPQLRHSRVLCLSDRSGAGGAFPLLVSSRLPPPLASFRHIGPCARYQHAAPTSQQSSKHGEAVNEPATFEHVEQQNPKKETSTKGGTSPPSSHQRSQKFEEFEELKVNLADESLSTAQVATKLKEHAVRRSSPAEQTFHDKHAGSRQSAAAGVTSSSASSFTDNAHAEGTVESKESSKSLWMRAKRKVVVIKGFFGSYLEGISLFAQELRLAVRLARRVYWERHRYSRRERLQLQQCAADLAKVRKQRCSSLIITTWGVHPLAFELSCMVSFAYMFACTPHVRFFFTV
jgi:hypothetical protein